MKPNRSISLRRIRTQAEWNVETHMIRARRPTRSSTRSRISAAALLVKVIARIEPGWALRSAISQAIRRVSTRVLPEPAPATTSSGAPACMTASRCGSLSPSSSCSDDAARRGVRAGGGGGREPEVELPLGRRGARGQGGRDGGWHDHVRSTLRPGADSPGGGRARVQRPFAEKCIRSETLEKSPPQVQPTAAKARVTTPPRSTMPGRCQDRSR